jgi:hypothetical protein
MLSSLLKEGNINLELMSGHMASAFLLIKRKHESPQHMVNACLLIKSKHEPPQHMVNAFLSLG